MWAAAHVFANGTLAYVIMFGSFAGFALIGGRLIDRRRQREMDAEWQRLRSAMQRPGVGALLFAQPMRLLAAAALYAALILAHPPLFGVSPIL